MRKNLGTERTFLWQLTIVLLTFTFIIGFSGTAFAWKEFKHDKLFDNYTDENAVYGGVMRLAATTFIRSLDPHVETAGDAAINSNRVYSGLLRLNQDMSGVELDAAKSWRQIDELTYEFKLREGILFHDIPPVNGREMTSADVKYSIERMSGKYPAKGCSWKHSYYFKDKLSAIETPDKYTVIFKTKQPYAPFVRYIAAAWTKIVPREAVEKWGNLKKKGLGTGPFMMDEYVKGSHYSYKKNPKYFIKGLPYLDGVHIRYMPKLEVQLAAYIAGKLDVFGVYPWQKKTIKEKVPESAFYERNGCWLRVLRTPPWIEGKIEPPVPYGDKRVRHAIAHAIDKKKLVQLGWFGSGSPGTGPVPTPYKPWSLGSEYDLEYNPEKAKKLLAEAGYPNGFDTEIMTWNATYMTKPVQVIQQMLKEVGIRAKLKPLEFAQYFNKVYTFKYPGMAFHIVTAGYDPEEWLVPYYGKLDGSTYYKWSNHELWDMIAKQTHMMDKEKRAAFIKEIQLKVIDESCQLGMFTTYEHWAHRPNVHVKAYFHPQSAGLDMYSWKEKK